MLHTKQQGVSDCFEWRNDVEPLVAGGVWIEMGSDWLGDVSWISLPPSLSGTDAWIEIGMHQPATWL